MARIRILPHTGSGMNYTVVPAANSDCLPLNAAGTALMKRLPLNVTFIQEYSGILEFRTVQPFQRNINLNYVHSPASGQAKKEKMTTAALVLEIAGGRHRFTTHQKSQRC
jgi:hypothetical protein